MGLIRRACGALLLAFAGAGGVAVASTGDDPAEGADFANVSASADARYVAQWVVDSRDNQGRPFAIVDKRDARVFVFGPGGRLIGAAPALLGMARGDHSVPGVGDLAPAAIPVADRTTPAGRFNSEPGRNLNGEQIVWFDYGAGLAIHRVRPDAAYRARLERLASASPDAHRVSAGCVVLPVGFYESVLSPTLGKSRGVVYVLPETRPVHEVFGADA